MKKIVLITLLELFHEKQVIFKNLEEMLPQKALNKKRYNQEQTTPETTVLIIEQY